MPHHFGDFKLTATNEEGEEVPVVVTDSALVTDDIEPDSLCYDDAQRKDSHGPQDENPKDRVRQ